MPGIDASTARGQKRKRAPEAVPAEDTTPPPPPPPPWKRAGFRSAEEANIAFWDNLSKVPLCPRALKELDRRNSLAGSSAFGRASWVDLPDSQRNPTALKGRSVQLKGFAKRGGPDLRDLRGYPEPAKAPSLTDTMPTRKTPYRTPSDSSNATSKSGRRTSAYHPGFEQNLINHGVYPDGYEYTDGRTSVKPDNWEEIQQRMVQPRPSLSPSQFSDGAFNNFRRTTNRALNEAEVMTNAFPIVRDEADIPSAIKRSFGNLAPLTDGTIVDAEPDFYYGARPEQVHPRIRKKLSSYIVPSTTNQSVPILPNYFTEGKGPTGTRAVAKRQALQDGGIGARAMHSLQSYGQPEPVYDNNAYTITSIFDGEHLHMYTTHPTQLANPGGQPEYHMNQLDGWTLTGNPEAFRQGATAYRNGRDWAKEKRDEFIETANGRVTSLPQDISFESSGYSEPSTSTNRATAPESDTSADELALDDELMTRRSSKRLKRGERERKYRESQSSR